MDYDKSLMDNFLASEIDRYKYQHGAKKCEEVADKINQNTKLRLYIQSCISSNRILNLNIAGDFIHTQVYFIFSKRSTMMMGYLYAMIAYLDFLEQEGGELDIFAQNNLINEYEKLKEHVGER